MICLNDSFCGSTFYQHGVGRYYLTPRQYEQLQWREEINKRRRDANFEFLYECDYMEEYELRRRCLSQKKELRQHQHSPAKSNVCTHVGQTQRKRNQLQLRRKEEEDEQAFHRGTHPLFFQISQRLDGRLKRYPVIASKRPCEAYKESNRLLPVSEENNAVLVICENQERDDEDCRRTP